MRADQKEMAMKGFYIGLAMGVFVATAAAAQTTSAPETYKFLSAKEIATLTDKPGSDPHTNNLVVRPGYTIEYALRTDSGNMVEVHAHTIHYINILEGQGTLTYGGTVNDPTEGESGEVRGPSVSGGTTVAIHAGDYMQIPAGTPHLFTAAPGTKLHYIVFNIKM
jgi:mannose-6-phosphate isomerase-like protein (cupin superfamily)